MNAPDRQTFRLVHKDARANALYAVSAAPDGYVVTVRPAGRSLDQNARLHAMLTDIANSKFEWSGCRRTVDELKVLFVSAHAIAEGRNQEVVKGFEDEPVALRESTAAMSKARLGSLMEYIEAWAAPRGIPLRSVKL